MSKKPAYEFQNLTKPQKDCLALIESLGIYELRALARIFGDNSPTTLKRDEHIVIVMEKLISGEELRPIPLRQGRPYKELSNIEGILAEISQITGRDYSVKSNQQRNTARLQKIVTFKQIEEDILKQKLFPLEVRGILCERNNKELYFINQENGNFVLVKKELDSRLAPSDYITGTAVIMNEDKEYILDTVKTINYKPAKSYEEVEEEYQPAVPTEKLKFQNKDILLGSRYLVKESKFTNDFENVQNLVNTLKAQNITTIALIPNVMTEDVFAISALGFDNALLLRYEESPIGTYEVIQSAIDHILNIQNQGLSVALFVEDVTTLANSIDFSFKTSAKAHMGHTETAVEMIKQLFMLAKAGGKNKNTTIFTTFDDVDMFDQMYVSSVYKISKKLELN